MADPNVIDKVGPFYQFIGLLVASIIAIGTWASAYMRKKPSHEAHEPTPRELELQEKIDDMLLREELAKVQKAYSDSVEQRLQHRDAAINRQLEGFDARLRAIEIDAARHKGK